MRFRNVPKQALKAGDTLPGLAEAYHSRQDFNCRIQIQNEMQRNQKFRSELHPRVLRAGASVTLMIRGDDYVSHNLLHAD